MLLLYVTARLRLPWCRSLKDKRAEARSLQSRLRRQFNVTVAETGSQDLHQLLTLGIAALAFDAAQADSIEENLYAFVEGATQGEITGWELEIR